MGKLKLAGVLATFVLLSACSRTVTQVDIKFAEEACKYNEGIYSIRVDDGNLKYVTCKNSFSKQIN
jgi:hypothetical protein